MLNQRRAFSLVAPLLFCTNRLGPSFFSRYSRGNPRKNSWKWRWKKRSKFTWTLVLVRDFKAKSNAKKRAFCPFFARAWPLLHPFKSFKLGLAWAWSFAILLHTAAVREALICKTLRARAGHISIFIFVLLQFVPLWLLSSYITFNLGLFFPFLFCLPQCSR